MKKVFTIIALELVVSFACQSVFAQKDTKSLEKTNKKGQMSS